MRMQSQVEKETSFLIFPSQRALWQAWGTQLEGPFQTIEVELSQQDPNHLWIPLKETPLIPKWETGQAPNPGVT